MCAILNGKKPEALPLSTPTAVTWRAMALYSSYRTGCSTSTCR